MDLVLPISERPGSSFLAEGHKGGLSKKVQKRTDPSASKANGLASSTELPGSAAERPVRLVRHATRPWLGGAALGWVS